MERRTRARFGPGFQFPWAVCGRAIFGTLQIGRIPESRHDFNDLVSTRHPLDRLSSPTCQQSPLHRPSIELIFPLSHSTRRISTHVYSIPFLTNPDRVHVACCSRLECHFPDIGAFPAAVVVIGEPGRFQGRSCDHKHRWLNWQPTSPSRLLELRSTALIADDQARASFLPAMLRAAGAEAALALSFRHHGLTTPPWRLGNRPPLPCQRF